MATTKDELNQIEERGVKTDCRTADFHEKYGYHGIKKMFSKVVATKNHYTTERVGGNRRFAFACAAMEKKEPTGKWTRTEPRSRRRSR